MRQRGATDGDVKFRTALEDMRYRSCTAADISLLSSRIASGSPSAPSLKDLAFRDVSLITSFNVDRDAMNADGAIRFAEEHGQRLHYFHSIDKWCTGTDRTTSLTEEARATRWQVHSSSGVIGESTQTLLWDLPPHCTDNHAGILPLCIGMPVLLKHNEATELCATNGAEGTVVSWHSHIENNHAVLDTLFVLLRAPARTIRIEGLPDNVIPLMRRKVRMKLLVHKPSQYLRWDREQICVLLNFAMTDFGAQGKTRPFNPCHLSNSRTHQSLYTCLSRSASLTGTLIMGSIDTAKMTGGCVASLRKEFQILEILDNITAARAKNVLPDSVRGATRRELVREWFHWKGANFVPASVHEAINWDTDSEIVKDWLREVDTVNKSLQNSKQKTLHEAIRSNAIPAPTQRVRDVSLDALQMGNTFRPRGMTWDSQNWSCAFDAALGIICNCFRDDGTSPAWKRTYGPVMTRLIARMRIESTVSDLDAMRDMVRSQLQCVAPAMFPLGRRMTSVSAVLYHLLEEQLPFATLNATCMRCNYTINVHQDSCLHIDTAITSHDCTDEVNLVDLLCEFLNGNRSQGGTCSQCSAHLEYSCDVARDGRMIHHHL